MTKKHRVCDELIFTSSGQSSTRAQIEFSLSTLAESKSVLKAFIAAESRAYRDRRSQK